MRAARLFALLDRLRLNSRPASARELADHTGVSERTIYRDIASLQAMGAPIRGEGGIGYQLEWGYFLPPLHFNKDELDAIALGMRLVAARGDDSLAEAARQVAGKVEALLPDADKGAVRDPRILAVSPSIGSLPILASLREAIRLRRKVNIDYLDLNGNRSQRRLRPLGLTAFDAVWLLTAWCEMKDSFRNFRVDRIEQIKIQKQRFAPEIGKEFRDYLATL